MTYSVCHMFEKEFVLNLLKYILVYRRISYIYICMYVHTHTHTQRKYCHNLEFVEMWFVTFSACN